MDSEILEFQFDDGIYFNFKNIDDLEAIAKTIEIEGLAELINKVVGIVSITRRYKSKNIEFDLIYHEDIGNCLKLSIDRDHSLDVENYGMLRNIGLEIIKKLK